MKTFIKPRNNIFQGKSFANNIFQGKSFAKRNVKREEIKVKSQVLVIFLIKKLHYWFKIDFTCRETIYCGKGKKVHLTRVKFKDPIPHPHIDFKNQSQLRRLLASRQVVSKNSFEKSTQLYPACIFIMLWSSRKLLLD